MHIVAPCIIKNGLDEFCLGQDDAKWALANAYFLASLIASKPNVEAQRCKMSARQHVMLVGPSGSGKSYLVRLLSLVMCIPYIHIDCSILTTPGWSGIDIYAELDRQMKQISFNKEIGILFLDEIDKICGERATQNHGDHNRSVQTSLLAVLDGRSTTGDRFTAPVDTSKFFIVAAGTFDQLKSVSNSTSNLRKSVTELGMMPELMNRFISVVGLNKLSSDEMLEIFFNNPLSPFNTYKELLNDKGINLDLTDIEKFKLKTSLSDGHIRALNSILFDILTPRFKTLSQEQFLKPLIGGPQV